ncbi:MAG: [protein-PII] uridylyltransferase [Candidatus Schekmanbacteria bacterium]|nr:[protein-PII] uridylyltransferase [Candidatus Schekmanbacteria bacterium]
METQQILSHYKSVLKAGEEKVRGMHRDGASSEIISGLLTSLWDNMLVNIYRDVCRIYNLGNLDDLISIVAVGGYGRETLSPHSDMDIMLLSFDGVDGDVAVLNEKILHLLWDIKVDLGYSVRTIKDCEELSKTDFTCLTSILESRYLLGNRRSFENFLSDFRKRVIHKRIDAFLREKILERNERYDEVGRIIQVLEPNVKDGAGGLRDVHTIYWIAKATDQIERITEINRISFLSDDERGRLLNAFSFIWKVRNDLHYVSGRKNDVLSLQFQAQVAHNLGYSDSGNKPAVEHFLKDYYSCAKSIAQVCTLFIRRMVSSRMPHENMEIVLRQRRMENGLIVIGNTLYLPRAGKMPDISSLPELFRIFKFVHDHDIIISEKLMFYIAERIRSMKIKKKDIRESVQLFMEILGSKKNISGLIRLMNEIGLIGAVIPEFKDLESLVQFDIYHHYTVDEHVLLALEKLDELISKSTRHDDLLIGIAAELERRDIMRLSILLHDIGKSGGKGHVERGTAMSKKILKRMGIPREEADKVIMLVSNHLSMMHTAEKRDFSENRVLYNFVISAGTIEGLRMLFLLTYCDVNAVSPHAWSDWRSELVRKLYFKAYNYLSMRLHEKIDEKGEIVRKIETVIRKVIEKSDNILTVEDVSNFFDKLPQQYIISTLASRIFTHHRLLKTIRQEKKFVTWDVIQNKRAGVTDFLVCFEGKMGSFSKICGVLTAKGIFILGAQIYTTNDGFAVDTLQCRLYDGNLVSDPEIWLDVEKELEGVLSSRVSMETVMSRKKRFMFEGKFDIVKINTEISINNTDSESYTIIEIQANDKLGLLYEVTNAIAAMSLDISRATTVTEGNRAVLVFYVTDDRGEKITARSKVGEITSNLKALLGSREEENKNVRPL